MRYRICLSVSTLDAEFQKMKDALEKVADVVVEGLENIDLSGCDIFIGKKLSKTALKTADKLKAVFAYKTGVDDFPLEQLKKMGVIVMNSHADAKYIAEYACGLGISLLNRITEFDKKMRKGIWYDDRNPYWRSIFDTKIGLLGYGHIGKSIHKVLKHNNIATYTVDRGKKYEDINLVSSVEDLCRECDLIIVSLPKTKQTDNIFNKDTIKLLKDKYIVNVGRSNCIDHKALYESLRHEHMAGAAIDTWDKKPRKSDEIFFPADSQYSLYELENVVISPHQAMRVSVGHARYVEDTLNKVLDYIKDGTVRDVVNLDLGY